MPRACIGGWMNRAPAVLPRELSISTLFTHQVADALVIGLIHLNSVRRQQSEYYVHVWDVRAMSP